MMDRTKKFALRVIRLVSKLPKNNVSRVIGGQLLRSGNLDWSRTIAKLPGHPRKSISHRFLTTHCAKLMKRCIGLNFLPTPKSLSQTYSPISATSATNSLQY